MTAIANGYSYEYQNEVRSVQETFMQLVASAPTFMGIIPVGAPGRATKEEWLNDSLAPVSSTIGSFDTDGDGTGINLVSTAGLRAGSILRFTTALDVSRTEQVQVVSVDSATDLTVTRDYGSSVGVTLVVGDKCYLVSSPKNESTSAVLEGGQEPDMVFNYMEILDRTASISKTAEAIRIYGLENALNYQVANKLQEIMYEMNAEAIYGRKVLRSSSVKGSFGGILQFFEGGNIDTTGGAVSATIINNMLEAIFQDGAFSNNYAILCAENQARHITALNTAGTNPVVNIQQQADNFSGGYVSNWVGDIPVMRDRGGFRAQIVVDSNMLKDQIAIVDLNRIEWAWLRTLTDTNAALEADDFYARRILGEVTLRIKNGTQAHALATGLTV